MGIVGHTQNTDIASPPYGHDGVEQEIPYPKIDDDTLRTYVGHLDCGQQYV